MMGVETWLLLATVVVLAWLYSKWRHNYWFSRGVPSPPTLPFFGNIHISLFINTKAWMFYQEIYTKYHDSSMCGMYEMLKPVLMVWDSEIIKHVFIKDFDHFANRRIIDLEPNYERDQVSMEMLSIKNGVGWKSLRAVMTPTFSSGKIKSMFPLVCDKADALIKFSMKQAAENPHVDMKKNFGRFTMDTIASCAFGIECNSLVDENAEFTRKVEAFFKFNFIDVVKGFLIVMMPKLYKVLPVPLNPFKLPADP